MRVADESGIVESVNGNTNEANPVVKMEDLLVEDGNVTLTIRLIMQGKVSVLLYIPKCNGRGREGDRGRSTKEGRWYFDRITGARNPQLMSLLLLLIIVMILRRPVCRG